MNLNQTFISNILDIHKEQRSVWLQDLPTRLQQLSILWGFHLLGSMPSLTYHYVGLVKMKSMPTTAVIKIAPDERSIAGEVKWLKDMEGAAPQIYAFDEKLNAFLMENLEPGYSLKTLLQQGNDDLATKIICQMIRDLQSQRSTERTFQHLSELRSSLSILRGRFDPKLLSKAEGLFEELTADRSGDVLLHGDLHHDNVLLGKGGWKVIDPHGYIGDPAAEVGPMIRNFFDCVPQDQSIAKAVMRRLHIMVDELPFDPQKIKAWAFCLTVLSVAWTFEGHGRIDEWDSDVASAIDQIPFF